MKVIFRTFNVGNGDCIALLLRKEDGSEMHFLIDCGNYTKEVDNFIDQQFHNVIDYLIVTHIDDDHISGLINMLQKKHGLEIKHILYNCYQRIPDNPQQWDDKMKANINRVMSNLPIVVDILEYKVSSQKAKTLAEVILSNDQWKRAWRRDYITDQTESIDLGNEFGRLVFLSPSMQALEVIDHLYRKLFWEKLYKQKIEDYNEEETIYEALIRCYQENIMPAGSENISYTDLTEQVLQQYAEMPLKHTSITNEASIAFIWESDRHRILFLGDSDPEEVCHSLKNKYEVVEKPVMFDAIKVSHHGSEDNTSKELIQLADSENFFFTGKTKTAPSLPTLSRIVTTSLPVGIAQRKINYNRESESIKSLKDRIDLQEAFNFTIHQSTEYETTF